VSRFTSVFSQLLQLFSRVEFQRAVQVHRAERHARGFTCWGQFVAMLFCQLGRAKSLREICGGLACCEGKLSHLGITAPRRATLAYANAHRPWTLYQAVFFQLLTRCHAVAKGHRKFRFKHKLLSLDASVIELCAAVFDWAQYKRTKGAVTLHLLLDHEGYLPSYAVITDGRVGDITVAKTLSFAPGTLLVMDRGYGDYAWFAALQRAGVLFVTRLRENAVYTVLGTRTVPTARGIRRDDLITLTGVGAPVRCPYPLRRVEVVEPTTGEPLVLLPNHLTFGATTIAAIYKERWQIELLFKVLKQHLKIKTFVGTSANALHIQLWTALIALLVLKYLKLRSTFGWSLSNLVALLQFQLFTHRDLWAWLNQPFTGPPVLGGPEQLALEGA
jgi:Domain of unknown function (DUF4372)/Transposase DDE domain